MTTKSTTTAQKINDMVSEIVSVPGDKSVRNDTQRRDGTKGFGWYTTVDVAYEGMRTVFFRTFAEAKAWYAEAKS